MNNLHFKICNFKILTRNTENFFIVIFYDLPFYIALPLRFLDFFKILKKELISYESIKKYLAKKEFQILFDYLLKKGIITNPEKLYFVKKNNKYKMLDKKVRKLYYISFQVTSKCNLHCIHCYADKGKEEILDLNLKEINILLNKLVKLADTENCNFILTGGEPFLREDIIKIIKYTKSFFNNVVVVTNGLLLDDRIINELSLIDNLILQVSLDGASKETHENIRGKNTYHKVINNIKKLISNNIKVYLSPLCSENFFNEIDKYFELAYELGVNGIQIQPVQYIGRAFKNNLKRIDGRLIIKKIFKFYYNSKYKNLILNGLESISIIHVRNLNKLNSCGTGKGTMYIRSNGDIYSCPNMVFEEFKIGNILKDDINNLYFNSPIYKKLRNLNINKSFDSECINCEFKHFCGGGCRGVAYNKYKKLNAKAVECKELKLYFEEILWSICKKNDFFKKESTLWVKNRIKNSKRKFLC